MGNPDKIVAVGLGEVLYDHDVVTDEYTFGGAPANFADHFLKCSRLISGPDAAEVHVVSAVGDDERGRAVSAELEARGLCDGLCRVGELPTGVVDKRRDAAGVNAYEILPGAWDAMTWSDALARLAAEDCEEKEDYKKALKENPSVDMALFGRMVASDPSLNYDAAAQVAHSISTHAVQNEYDYFTAVDDCQAEDNAGAGHLGTVEYNSSTLYRYATVNVMELAGQLGAAQAAETVRAFGEAFLFSMPTGRQNTFANRTLPDAVYVTLREDQPVNLCGAFEQAVPRSAQGYAAPSKAALAQYAQQMYGSFAEAPAQSFTVGSGLEVLAPAQTAKAMLDALEKSVRDALAGNEVG